MKIRTFQPGDDESQVSVFNAAVADLPGSKLATVAEVRKRTGNPAFDPTTRFYAEEAGKVVGYCTLEPEQGRVSFPWCVAGSESIAPQLLEATIQSARERGLTKLFAAYRRDWLAVTRFFGDHGFSHTRDMVNYWLPPGDSLTIVNSTQSVDVLKPEDIPAIAAMGQGVLRLPLEKLEAYFFANPYFPASAVRVLRAKGTGVPFAVGLGIENGEYADVRKIDPLAPCFRLGAFGTEGLSTKRVNGLFGFMVAEPDRTATAGLTLLGALSVEMTDGSVHAFAAQCPSDVRHLVGFYSRYFKEQGRFPLLERSLT